VAAYRLGGPGAGDRVSPRAIEEGTVILRRTMLPVLLGVTGGLALVAPASAATARVLSVNSMTEAGFTATSTATSVSALVMVPTAHCNGQAPGTVAGQDTGVHLASGGEQISADIRVYCTGHQARYQTEFVVFRTGHEVYAPANVAVSPNDGVFLSAAIGPSGSVVRMKDLTTGAAAATARGRPLASASPSVIMTRIAANSAGRVLMKGPPPSGNPVVPGPVSATTTELIQNKADGQPLGSAAGLTQVIWVNSANQEIVTPTALGQDGRNFGLVVSV